MLYLLDSVIFSQLNICIFPMNPYTYIEYALQSIIAESIPYEVEYWHFVDEPRWNFEAECDNIQRARLCGKTSFYDYKNKSWQTYTESDNTSHNRGFKRILSHVIDHSFEPVLSELDRKFWHFDYFYNRAYPWKECKHYTGYEDFPMYVLHSEQSSKDVDQLQAWGYNTVYWFSHALLCSSYYFKPYEHLELVKNYLARPLLSPWICANRLTRKHRTDFLELIDVSLGEYSLLNPDPLGVEYTGPVSARSFDEHSNHSAEINITNLTPWNTSFLHVVNETVWQDKIHFTEKIFKPIVMHQPFVVLQAPGSLEYLKGYGFKTFADWWDESYDAIEDPQQRMQAVADIVNWITTQDINKMRHSMKHVLEYNYDHFYNNIPEIVLDELRVNLENAVSAPLADAVAV